MDDEEQEAYPAALRPPVFPLAGSLAAGLFILPPRLPAFHLAGSLAMGSRFVLPPSLLPAALPPSVPLSVRAAPLE